MARFLHGKFLKAGADSTGSCSELVKRADGLNKVDHELITNFIYTMTYWCQHGDVLFRVTKIQKAVFMSTKNKHDLAKSETSIQNDVDTSIYKAGQSVEDRRSAIDAIEIKVKQNGLPFGVNVDPNAETDDQDETTHNRITAKMRLFTSYIAQGDSAVDAYKKSYDCSRYQESSIVTNANKLMRDARIIRILEPILRAKEEMVINDAIATRRHVMSQLFKHSDDVGIPISVRVRSLELMGKAVGMFVDKVESKVEEINAEQLKNELSSHLELLNKATSKH